MAQTLSISPEMWARTRRKAFDMQTTASKIVEAALGPYLDQLDRDGKPPAAEKPPASEKPPGRLATGGPHGVKLMEVSVTSEKMPWDPPTVVSPLRRPVPIEGMPWDDEQAATSVTKTFKATGEAVIGQDALPPPADVKLANGESATMTSEVVVPAEGPPVISNIRVIKDPKEVEGAIAKAVEAKLVGQPREFHPVPKPTSTKKPRR